MNPMNQAALRCLYTHLGFWMTLKLAVKSVWSEWQGRPFTDLPPASTPQDQQTRTLLGPAVLLYRFLQNCLPYDEAVDLTQKVIESSGHAFLKTLFTSEDLHHLQSLSQKEQEAWIKPKLERIPNVDFQLHFEGDTLHFTVHACRFVELGRQLGVEEIIPFFCAVDQGFFGTILPEVQFSRSTTLAQGGATCPFIFSFAPSLPSEPSHSHLQKKDEAHLD